MSSSGPAVAERPPRATGEPRPPHPSGISPIVLGFSVFTSGAVLLGVEIAASRVLAPYFGTSLFVWGALIGVVLSGLALGYWLGGALADRLPASTLLAAAMAAGGVAVLVVPLIDEPVLEGIVSLDPGPRLNPVLAAIALFGIPSVILACATPIAVRLAGRSLRTMGRTAGRLFSISTVGSIVGTFLTAFYLVPELGTDQLIALLAAVLLGAVVVLSAAERLRVMAVLGVGLCAGAIAATVSLAPETGGRLSEAQSTNWSPVYRLATDGARPEDELTGLTLVHARDSRYHRIVVAEDSSSRYLRFDNTFQSGMYLDDPFATRFPYTDYLQLGLAYNPDAERVLFIGLGGGSAPKLAWRAFPALELTVAELDPDVVEIAYEYFDVPRDPRLRIEVEDGRQFLAGSSEQWDVIAIDAFYADAIPFHLATREFLELARSRLSPGGVVVTNVIGTLEGPRSRLFRSLYRTYRSAFSTVSVHPVIRPGTTPETLQNLILVATEGAAPSTAFLDERWDEIRERAPLAPDLRRAIAERRDAPIPLDGVPLLTDDYAPTDALLVVD
jgi:spermidine synthase/MFS family permease